MEEVKKEFDISGLETNTATTDDLNDPEITIDTDKLFQPQRLQDESFEDYKERRLVAHYKVHQMAKGKLIWNSRPDATKKGDTYRKVK